MKILVTGGAGFIGSHTVDALLRTGHSVTVLDDLSTGNAENLPSGVSFIRGSILDDAALCSAVAGQDGIVHLAAFTSVPDSFGDHDRCFETNGEGTFRVLDAAVVAEVDRVVFASSSAVYAEEPRVPKSEQECPDPASPYAVSKLEGEHLLARYHRRHGIRYVALRYFNVYGPRQRVDSDYAAVIPIFVQRGIEGLPCTVCGDGMQTRDFVHVSDVARANVSAIESDARGVFNVGTGKGTSILTLAKAIARLTGSFAGCRFEDRRPGDVLSSEADVSRVVKHLRWQPQISLEQGLEMTTEWSRAVYRERETAYA